MTATRRRVLTGATAASAVLAMPGLVRAQASPPRAASVSLPTLFASLLI